MPMKVEKSICYQPVEEIKSLALSKDGKWFVTGGNIDLKVWKFETAECTLTINKAHRDEIESLEISPDDKWLVSASHDHTMKCWILGTSDIVWEYETDGTLHFNTWRLRLGHFAGN